MTDKQLEEYTRLKIEEVTKPLFDKLKDNEKKYQLECDKHIELIHKKCDHIIAVYLVDAKSQDPDPIVDIQYLEVSEERSNWIARNKKAVESFVNDTLFNRLKKAFKGEL